MEVAIDTMPSKRGPKVEGLRTLVFDTAILIENHTGKLINRSSNRWPDGEFACVEFFKRLNATAGFPGGGSEKSGGNVESMMAEYIRMHRALDRRPDGASHGRLQPDQEGVCDPPDGSEAVQPIDQAISEEGPDQ
jgi:hypothetical protein